MGQRFFDIEVLSSIDLQKLELTGLFDCLENMEVFLNRQWDSDSLLKILNKNCEIKFWEHGECYKIAPRIFLRAPD